MATLIVITTVTAVVSSLGAPLVPAIASEFGVSLDDAQWSLTAAMLTAVVATPLLGRTASGSRRKPVLAGSLALVLAGTVMSGVAPAFGWLLAGRAMQGVGLSVLPVVLAIARDELDSRRVPRALAILSVTTVAGAGLGYPLTSFVAAHFGLSGAYFAGTALMACTLALTVAAVPGRTDPPTTSTDLVGASLLGAGLCCLLLALSRGETWGWASGAVLGLAVVGAGLVAGFVRRTLRVDDPLVDLRLAARPGLANPNLVAVAAGIGMYSLLTLAVVLVQADWGLGRSVAVAGWVLVPYSVMALAGTWLSQVFRRHMGVRYQLALGCLVFAGACTLMAVRHNSLAAVLLAMGVGGIGSGFTFSSMAVIMVPHLPAGETGSAMALNMLLRTVGFTVGSALTVTLMHLFGGVGPRGFVGALAVIVGLWLTTAALSAVMDARTRPSREGP